MNYLEQTHDKKRANRYQYLTNIPTRREKEQTDNLFERTAEHTIGDRNQYFKAEGINVFRFASSATVYRTIMMS